LKRVIVLALALALPCGCGHTEAPKPPPAPLQPLHLEPLVDLAPAASLVWLLELHPRALALDARLAGPIARTFPEGRLTSFRRWSGGVDPREAETWVAAAYPSTTLWLVHQFIDPARVEAAFTQHLVTIEGRAADGFPGDRRSVITRLWGTSASQHEQLAIFGVDAVGLEEGRFGPLRATELFAEGRLKRASPALRAEPLARLAAALGDAPVRAFAPGPFEGDLQHGVGGLLGATTAVGAAARVVDGLTPERPGLTVHVAMLGAWGADADAASERLRAVFDLVAQSSLGRLLGLGRCLSGPVVNGAPEVLTLDFTLDVEELARGLYAATSADAKAILAPINAPANAPVNAPVNAIAAPILTP
jgi:hypothetical protein